VVKERVRLPFVPQGIRRKIVLFRRKLVTILANGS